MQALQILIMLRPRLLRWKCAEGIRPLAGKVREMRPEQDPRQYFAWSPDLLFPYGYISRRSLGSPTSRPAVPSREGLFAAWLRANTVQGFQGGFSLGQNVLAWFLFFHFSFLWQCQRQNPGLMPAWQVHYCTTPQPSYFFLSHPFPKPPI